MIVSPINATIQSSADSRLESEFLRPLLRGFASGSRAEWAARGLGASKWRNG